MSLYGKNIVTENGTIQTAACFGDNQGMPPNGRHCMAQAMAFRLRVSPENSCLTRHMLRLGNWMRGLWSSAVQLPPVEQLPKAMQWQQVMEIWCT